MSTEERDKKIVDITFHSTPQRFRTGWGWKIPRNPGRTGDEFQEAELEVMQLAQTRTVQEPEVWRTTTYVYSAPFNYPNVKVELGRPGTGVEFNHDGAEIDIYPYGSITIEHNKPIVAVTTIGSGCSTQGYVILEAEPLEWKYPRTAVRMRRDQLWGTHVRGDAWNRGIREDWNDAGLSSARFDIPDSRMIVVGGGSLGADPHYCFRIIRLEVRE